MPFLRGQTMPRLPKNIGCHGANHFSLSSLAEQENDHDDKTKILLIDLLDFTRFSASMRKK